MSDQTVETVEAPKMKLSEAIRKGCENTAPCYGKFTSVDYAETNEDACAMGAALIVAFGSIKNWYWAIDVDLADVFPFGAQVRRRYEWKDIISRLNDRRILTREQIADMLETMAE